MNNKESRTSSAPDEQVGAKDSKTSEISKNGKQQALPFKGEPKNAKERRILARFEGKNRKPKEEEK